MGKARFCLRLTPLLSLRAAVVLAAAAAAFVALSSGGTFSPSERASAASAFDLAGVICIDIYFDNSPFVVNKGDAPGMEDLRAVKILARLDPHPTQANAWLVSSESVQGPGGIAPTGPPTANSCEQKTDNNQLLAGVSTTQVPPSPTPVAKLVGKQVIWQPECSFIPDPINLWVLTEFNIVVDGDPNTPDFGINSAFLHAANDPNRCTMTNPLIQFDSILVVVNRTPSTSDWDGDGCTDFNELDPVAVAPADDPFTAACGAVGGIAELPEIADAPLKAVAESSRTSAVFVALVGAALMAGALGLGAAAWHARRSRSG